MSKSYTPAMPAVLRNHGLDLPIFSTDDVIVSRSKFADAAQQPDLVAPLGTDTFIRRTTLNADDYVSLKGALRAADEELNIVADYCSANVIGHKWGLYEAGETILDDGEPSELLPKGYLLAAEVDAVIDATKPDFLASRAISIALGDYRDRRTRLFSKNIVRAYLTDMHTNQFVIGSPPSALGRGLWLVDIEPLISLP
ncbi:MAG: hypothetical protein ABI354_00090 [Candidatus Saccharimonadales bacterium]